MIRRPNTYRHAISFSPKQRAEARIYFSPREIRHLMIALLLVGGIGLSVLIYSGSIVQMGWFGISLFSIMLSASFFIHEIAHKITAQREGLWAEFRLTLWGALLTLVSVFSPLKIISPGAVMIAGAVELNEIGKISIAGPITNLILSIIFLGGGFIPTEYSGIFVLMAFYNAWIALFNLFPFGILDGYKIFSWNRKIWLFTFLSSLTLTVASYSVIL